MNYTEHDKLKVGVYVCHCGTNIASKVDISGVVDFANSLDCVRVARDYKFMCSSPGQEMIANDVREKGINRVVVASCSPRMHEATFRKVCETAGINPYLLQMANIREHVAWITSDLCAATDKAIAFVSSAIARVLNHFPLELSEVKVQKSILVIGGGIAGMQAAIVAAQSGHKVYLVEREPSIGGHMSKFDKTFPTLDCAACVMTPKMVIVDKHPNICLMTYSEVFHASGFVGNYTITIKRKPRYINSTKCVGCGLCYEKCPSRNILSEFDQDLGYRSAIYSTFPQAVPKTPVIDPNSCRVLGYDKACGLCEKVCEADAIDFKQRAEYTDIRAGSVIVATGFKLFDPSSLSQYGYGRFPEVYTSLEFERLNNATGPTNGSVVMKNGQIPESVAIIHCVGSRDVRNNRYCSKVCCMYSMKFAQTIREKTDAQVWEFYIDIRSAGKSYEEFYNRVQQKGVHFIRGRVAEVTDIISSNKNRGQLTIIAENTLTCKPLRLTVDMIILSTGMEPANKSNDLGNMLRIPIDRTGWFTELHAKLAPVSTSAPGIFLAGCCQGPKDIPETVAQASAAAGEAVSFLSKGTVSTLSEVSQIDIDICTGCKLCLDSCTYGAIVFNDGPGVAAVNEIMCQGCGACAAICPSSAASVSHFTDRQLIAELEALLS